MILFLPSNMGSFQEGHVPLSYWALCTLIYFTKSMLSYWALIYFTKSLDMEHGVDMIYLGFQKMFDTAPYTT